MSGADDVSAAGGPDVAALVAVLVAADETVATAESLTGGLVVAALTDVPGASASVRGGLCAYHPDVKASLAGVDPALLAGGAVQAEVAAQLAAGARERFRATWGVGTTGVAGPDRSDNHRVGTVFVAVAGPGGVTVQRLALTGSRDTIRRGAVTGALDLLARRRAEDQPAVTGPERVP